MDDDVGLLTRFCLFEKVPSQGGVLKENIFDDDAKSLNI